MVRVISSSADRSLSFPESERGRRVSRIAATNDNKQHADLCTLYSSEMALRAITRDLRSQLTVSVRAMQRVVHLLVPFRLIVPLDFLKAIFEQGIAH